jgi:hypothetical protein
VAICVVTASSPVYPALADRARFRLPLEQCSALLRVTPERRLSDYDEPARGPQLLKAGPRRRIESVLVRSLPECRRIQGASSHRHMTRVFGPRGKDRNPASRARPPSVQGLLGGDRSLRGLLAAGTAIVRRRAGRGDGLIAFRSQITLARTTAVGVTTVRKWPLFGTIRTLSGLGLNFGKPPGASFCASAGSGISRDARAPNGLA